MTTALAPIATTSVAPRQAALPTPIDKDALKQYLKAIDDPTALELQRQLAAAYDKACAALIGDNDVQVEQGRTFKKKSAWRKLGRYFGITTEVVAREHEIIGEEFVAMVTVRATAPWGQVADAVGACGTDEEKGRRQITMADAIATAETRATNRATSNLIAMGEVSAEEVAKNQVAQESARDITLEEAKQYPFPWRNPEKYRGKPMGNLSYNMLGTVLDAIVKEIEKQGETPKRLEIKRVCELLMAEAEEDEERLGPTTSTSDASSPSTTNGSAASSKSSSPTASDPLDEEQQYVEELAPAPREEPKPPPAKGAPDSVYALAKRLRQLIERPEFSADMRDLVKLDMRTKVGKPGYETWLQKSVESAEELLAGALEPDELNKLGIVPR